jgi:hypothetical protein
MPHHIVDCSEDPYDLRPATEEITQQIFDLTNQGNGRSKPVIVIMGEIHTNPLHRLLQQAVMANCLKENQNLSVAYHMEHEHNLLGHIARTREGINFLPQLDSTLKHHDKNGQMLVQAVLKHEPIRYATKSAESVLGFCLDRGISVAFTDIAKRYYDERRQVFDWRDPETQLILTMPHGEALNVESPQGMALRNHFMAQKTTDIIVQRKPDVVVHHCGREHVLGDTPSGFSFADSLLAKFLAKGFPTIAVFPETKADHTRIPPEAFENTALKITVSGLANLSFGKNDPQEMACLHQCRQASRDMGDNYADSSQVKIWKTSVSRNLPLIKQARNTREMLFSPV